MTAADTLPPEVGVRLGHNRKNLLKPDNHGEIWEQLATAHEVNTKLLTKEMTDKEKDMSIRYALQLEMDVEFPLNHFRILWNNVSWRPWITRWCKLAFCRELFKIGRWYYMAAM